MNTQKQTSVESVVLYKKLRSIPVGAFDAKKIKEIMAQKNDDLLSEPGMIDTASLFHKVASQVSESQWVDFINTQEVPPVKLTSKEMELLKGGKCFLSRWIHAIAQFITDNADDIKTIAGAFGK